MTVLRLPVRADAVRKGPKAALRAVLLASLFALVSFAAVPATAGAVVTTVEGNTVGLQSRNVETMHEANAVFVGNLGGFFEPEAETFNNPAGNPVVHGSNVYVIYWDPKFRYHGDWKNLIDTFLESVNAAAGGNDVFAVDTQYTDKSNVPAQNTLTYRGAYTDTRPYPTSECTDPEPLESNEFSKMGPLACLTAQQLEFEVKAFISVHKLPTGMNTVYYLLTPPGVTACLHEGGLTGHCSDFSATAGERATSKFETESYRNSFCSYHADVNPDHVESGDANTILYAVVPWIAGGEGDGQLARENRSEAAFCQDGGFDPSSKPIEKHEEEKKLTLKEEEKLAEMNEEEKANFVRTHELQGPHEQEPNQVPCPSSDGYCDTGLADLIINQIAVEQQNIVTDPLLNSWKDKENNEATDECRNFFARALGGTSTANNETGAGTLFNQLIGVNHYYLNDAFNRGALDLNYPAIPCLPGITLDPKFTASSPVNTGDVVAFDAGESTVSLNENVNYTESGEGKPHYATVKWNFGDGTPEETGFAPGTPICEESGWVAPCAESVFHSYKYGGAYTVRLTITDVGGNSASTTRTVSVAGPPPPTPEGAGSGSSSGSSGSSSSASFGATGSKGAITSLPAPVPVPVASIAVTSHSLKRVLSSGLVVRYSVNEQVAGHFEVLLSSKLAKHLKISGALAGAMPAGAEPQVVIGRALLVTLKGGRGTVHVILSKSAGKRLHNLKRLAADIRLIAHNAATVNPASTTVVSAFALGR